MRNILPESLLYLADACRYPLYIVGGSVRDFLAGLPAGGDFDICSPAPEEALREAAAKSGFSVKAVYRNTGTVKLSDGSGKSYEFTRFRTDKYVRGMHRPTEIAFTDDIGVDARRRDFCANAVYYAIARGDFCDPLDGIRDIHARILRTVAPAEKVFGEDGLRLLRLARIAAQTGFSPDEECLAGARANAKLIDDIVPERIFTELCMLLTADMKLCDGDAPYRGLKILHATGVLQHILPELALGDGMAQRSDFHAHDILEHSFRCVRYSPPDVRWAALLHDVGKPFCMKRDGNFYAHAEEGARIAEKILTRLKAPLKLTEETALLIKLHMRDLDLTMKENKVRREIVRYMPLLDKLFDLKQADFSACRDDLSPAPFVVKWQVILARMKSEGVPFAVSELKIGGRELQKLGIPPAKTGQVLTDLLYYCCEDGARNTAEHLQKHVKRAYHVGE